MTGTTENENLCLTFDDVNPLPDSSEDENEDENPPAYSTEDEDSSEDETEDEDSSEDENAVCPCGFPECERNDDGRRDGGSIESRNEHQYWRDLYNAIQQGSIPPQNRNMAILNNNPELRRGWSRYLPRIESVEYFLV
tara:strand:+ start:262 stop:675 length:414 start_codon:yes stop_codon:yes gene_type:complete